MILRTSLKHINSINSSQLSSKAEPKLPRRKECEDTQEEATIATKSSRQEAAGGGRGCAGQWRALKLQVLRSPFEGKIELEKS